MARKIKIDNAVLKRLERKQQKEIKCKKILCRILIVCEGEKTEPQYFKKFKAKNNNSFTYEVKCTAYNGPEYAIDLEFKLLRVAKDKAPIYEQQVKEDYKLYPTLLAFFSSGNNGDKRVQAAITWVFFNEKDEVVFIYDRMPIIDPGQIAGNGGKCFPIPNNRR